MLDWWINFINDERVQQLAIFGVILMWCGYCLGLGVGAKKERKKIEAERAESERNGDENLERHKPYCYRIRCVNPNVRGLYGKDYIGVRFGMGADWQQLLNRGHKNPYFTSSDTVKTAIMIYGEDSFMVVGVKTYATKDAALKAEKRMLEFYNVENNPRFINKWAGNTDEDYENYIQRIERDMSIHPHTPRRNLFKFILFAAGCAALIFWLLNEN